MIVRQTAAEIEREATDWLMRLDCEGRTPELEAMLQQWLIGDERRRGAMLQAEAAWYLLSKIGAQEPDNSKDCLSAPEGVGTDELPSSPRISRRKLIVGGGSALAASLAGGLYLPMAGVEYSTLKGEVRRVPLTDGSVVAINTASLIHARVASGIRLVSLDRGEAWFQVAKDKSRPFLVEAGPVRIRAVGTAFSVRRYDNGAEVIVTEGVVRVWTDGADGHQVQLVAGEQAFVADNAAITRASSSRSNVDRALAWRGGTIDLAGERLGDAAFEFNRYNQRLIVISDPSVANERFYGVFRTDDPDGFVAAIENSLNVSVDRSRADEIRIEGAFN